MVSLPSSSESGYMMLLIWRLAPNPVIALIVLPKLHSVIPSEILSRNISYGRVLLKINVVTVQI